MIDTGPGLQGAELSRELIDAGILIPTGVDGLYGRSAVYVLVSDAVAAMVSRAWSHERPTTIRFPPIVARSTFARTGYLESFPDLMGAVGVFRGNDRDHAELLRRGHAGEPWDDLLEPAETMLCSASCHPIYPLCSGTVPEDGRRFEVDGWCFRHEPSLDPARMQSFRMQELVYVGTSAGAQEHRDIGLERGLELLRGLGLEMTAVPANDPFFGRVGTVLARAQLDEELKIEGVTPIAVESPTAVMSANCHRQHFAEEFDIRLEDGALTHSACVAFGIDRVTIALIRLHGATTEPWPASVRDSLWP